jgi:hypothetical protein
MLNLRSLRNSLLMVSWVALLLVLALMLLHYHREDNLAEQLAFKSKRGALIDRMRLGLASASEAEKSAVMARTEQESKTFADQARAASTAVEADRRELERLMEAGGGGREQELLAQFSRAFAECQRIDTELLDLAVKNTNLKAFSLAFGPAAEALAAMDGALSRLIAEYAATSSSEAKQVIVLAAGAQNGALRIQALLPPHIAEESETKMDQLEAEMAANDVVVRNDLDRLSALLGPGGGADLKIATAGYARFNDLKLDILRLSRQNTNVRSLAISLNQKRTAVLLAQDALAAVEQAILAEPVSDRTPQLPR